MEEVLYVTHYVPEPPPRLGLKAVEFLTTRDSERGKEFYSGFDRARTFSEKDITSMLNNDALFELPKPARIEESEGVLIDQENSVWIADYNNPLEDTNKRKIYQSLENLK